MSDRGLNGPLPSCGYCGSTNVKWDARSDTNTCLDCGWNDRKYFVGLHRNSFNAYSGAYSVNDPAEKLLKPIVHVLVHVGYVLCDILEVLEDIRRAEYNKKT